MKKCNSYLDDYPGLRGECEAKRQRNEYCHDCPEKVQEQEPVAWQREKLKARLAGSTPPTMDQMRR